jgi:hypothetical protein
MQKSKRFVHLARLGCLLACLLAAGGCGEGDSNLQVSGKITRDGQPLTVSDKGEFVMVFHELQGGQLGGHAYAATVDHAGAYRVALPPGKYRVAVQLMDPYVEHVDKLGGAYDQAKSPLTVEIAESRDDLNIELNQA